jgi:hypothetical protein
MHSIMADLPQRICRVEKNKEQKTVKAAEPVFGFAAASYGEKMRPKCEKRAFGSR